MSPFYEHAVFIDTSAILALFNTSDSLHKTAKNFFENISDVDWFVLNATIHETFTRNRYGRDLHSSLEIYDNLKGSKFKVLRFEEDDENKARALLEKYDDKVLSFHDALCAAVMIKIGIYKIFSFDSDFWSFGFFVMPGITR
jgi:predicted nucleic acid-binding protein